MFIPMAEYFTMEEAKLSQWEALIKIEIDKIFKIYIYIYIFKYAYAM